MTLHIADVNAVARGLTRPFYMEQIARVDHFAVYLYHCEGVVARHQHIAQDELFYVQSGLLSLDTDWGRVSLAPHELTVVPRGLFHVSGSLIRTLVLLFQAHSDPERKNGHGRLVVGRRSEALPKWSVRDEVERVQEPYLPRPLAQVDEMSLRVISCEGESLWHVHDEHDELLLVEEGRLDLGSEEGPVTLEVGELVVIPRKHIHRLAAPQRAVVLSLIHGAVEPSEQMGR